MRIPVKLADGTVVYMDAAVATPGGAPAPADDALVPRGAAMGAADEVLEPQRFNAAVRVVQGVASELMDGLYNDQTHYPPTDVKLELSLGFDAGGKVFFASAGAHASLKLELAWKLDGRR